MTTKKFDRRYASERQAAEFDKQRNPQDVAPILYRADILRLAKARKNYRLGFRDIAAATSLSVNTVRDALDGNASKIEALWKLCRYFEIPWIALFDVDKKLTVILKERTRGDGLSLGSSYNGFEITAADFATPETASPSGTGKAGK